MYWDLVAPKIFENKVTQEVSISFLFSCGCSGRLCACLAEPWGMSALGLLVKGMEGLLAFSLLLFKPSILKVILTPRMGEALPVWLSVLLFSN